MQTAGTCGSSFPQLKEFAMKKMMVLFVLVLLASAACGANSYTRNDAHRYILGTFRGGFEIVSEPDSDEASTNKDRDTYVLCNNDNGAVKIVTITANDWTGEPESATERTLGVDVPILCGKPTKDPQSRQALITSIENVINDTNEAAGPISRYYAIKKEIERAKQPQ